MSVTPLIRLTSIAIEAAESLVQVLFILHAGFV